MTARTLLGVGEARSLPSSGSSRGTPVHPHRIVLRLVSFLMMLLLIGTVALAGSLNTILLIAVIVTALAVLTAVNDLFATLAFVVCCVLLWAVSGVSATSWWCLPIAVELLIVHAAQTLAALGPAEAPIPRAVGVAWARRTVWVAAATSLVAAAGITVSTGAPAGTAYAAAALVILLAVGVALLPRLFGPDDA